MKEAPLKLVGLEELDAQCRALAAGAPNDPDFVNRAWFFMYCYKVLLCPKRYSHDWGACPYAHANESARRRDPQRYSYSSCICPNTGKGDCPHGPQCRYAHTLFEYWLHPARFRTQMCKAGANCKRALCFFAHSHAELRQPDKVQDNQAQPSAVQLATAAAALAAGPGAAGEAAAAAGALSACRSLEAVGPLLQVRSSGTLAPAATGFDSSSSSSLSCTTCQQGGSPLALNNSSDLSGSGEFGSRVMRSTRLMGSSGSLQAAPATAGLLAQFAQQRGLPAALAAGGYPAVSTAAAAGAYSTGLVGGVPQLQDLLLQQQQQQQQLMAGMAAMSLAQGPLVYEQQQLQPVAGIGGQLVASSALAAPAVTAAALVAPMYATALPAGMPAAAAVPSGLGPATTCAGLLQQQQQQQLAPMGMSLQQVYLPAGQQVPAATNLQYAWMN